MPPSERFGFASVAGDHGVQDRRVLIPETAWYLVVVAQNLAHDAAEIVPVRRRRFADQGIARDFIQKSVKRHVGGDLLRDGPALDGSAAVRDQSSPLRLRALRAVLGRQPGGEPLQ